MRQMAKILTDNSSTGWTTVSELHKITGIYTALAVSRA